MSVPCYEANNVGKVTVHRLTSEGQYKGTKLQNSDDIIRKTITREQMLGSLLVKSWLNAKKKGKDGTGRHSMELSEANSIDRSSNSIYPTFLLYFF